MCSTPFGVTVFFTQLARPPPARRRVLNAFRRHCLLHDVEDVQRGSPAGCSTPFGVTVFFTPSPSPTRAGTWVLNAFRRHCLLHGRRSGSRASSSRCSTPFGVTVFFTAQGDWNPSPLTRCSTPFGVTVFFTQLRPVARSSHAVLNAFRRHCLLHSAATGTTATAGVCAQRLSASLSSSHDRRHAPTARPPVLNAFRRHCLLHTRRSTPSRWFGSVLNAFRRHCLLHAVKSPCLANFAGAQRLSASLSSSHNPRLYTGWRGSCAQRLSASLSSSPVTATNATARAVTCSTPFGVTVFFTMRMG